MTTPFAWTITMKQIESDKETLGTLKCVKMLNMDVMTRYVNLATIKLNSFTIQLIIKLNTALFIQT